MFQWINALNTGPNVYNVPADVVGDQIYVFSGDFPETHDSPIKVFVLDANTMEWTTKVPNEKGEAAPSYRFGHSAVAYGDLVYLWGGGTFYNTNDLYIYNTKNSTWRKISTEMQPSYRMAHSAWIHGNRMYIFGGYDIVSQKNCSDLHYLDLDTNLWHLVRTTGNPPCNTVALSVAVINHKMFMFVASRMVYLDLEKHHWDSVEMGKKGEVAFSYRNNLYSFPGTLEKYVDCIDPETLKMERVEIIGPPHRKVWGYNCVVVGSQMFMFGGMAQFDPSRSVEPNECNTLVLDLAPSLRILVAQRMIENNVDISCLPKPIQRMVDSLQGLGKTDQKEKK